MKLQDILYSQGFGTRRECTILVNQGAVCIDGVICADPLQELDPEGLVFTVQGQFWTYRPKAYLMLHKPAGTECSHRPSIWPSVYSLLPAPLRLRPVKGAQAGVQAVGRLDQDTTGLLLLTDDGKLIHRLNSPRAHVPKVYEITTAAPVDQDQLQRLRTGVLLNDESSPVRAAACESPAAHALRLTLTEGKYHQVKRMVAAAGNHVVALHRSGYGRLALPADLQPGQFRWLTQAELASLQG